MRNGVGTHGEGAPPSPRVNKYMARLAIEEPGHGSPLRLCRWRVLAGERVARSGHGESLSEASVSNVKEQ